MTSALDPLSGLPAPSSSNVTVRLTSAAARAARRGHPWIYDGGLTHLSHEGAPGERAVLFGPQRRFVGLGLYDPRSPIRVKVVHAGAPTPIDATFFAARAITALGARASLTATTETDGYRVVHGESDGLPGLIVDRYGDTLVVKLYSEIWGPWLRAVLDELLVCLDPTRVVLRLARALQPSTPGLPGLRDGLWLRGAAPEAPLTFRERDVVFEVDPIHGHKTGFYLDQRDNRARVEALAKGCDVLNVFSYTGGFSLFAARGGARAVTSLDISAQALAAAQRNFARNASDARIDARRHETLEADAFEGLRALAAQGRRFDLVVVDPPSFAQRRVQVERALGAYARLTTLALGVLEPDGRLVLASCSSQVDAEAFRANAEAAAQRAGRPLRVDDETRQPLDHPVGFAEAAYLKCLYARA